MTNARVTADSPEICNVDGQIMQAEAQNRWQEAARLLGVRAQRVAPVQEQVHTLEHLASVYRVKLGDERHALMTAEEIVRIAPTHTAARQYLAESYARSGDQAKLQALNASAPAQASHGGVLSSITGAVTGAMGAAATAVGAAATGFAGAVEKANKNPEWMRPGPGDTGTQPLPTAAAPDPRAAELRCPYCGADQRPGASSCSACGAGF